MTLQEEWTPDSLMSQAVQALAANDASELKRLIRIAEHIRARTPESRLDDTNRCLFSAVLAETSRNLRLLKRVYMSR